MDPRLRDLTRQLLLAVTHAETVEEAVLVLMTDAAADTAAQVLSAALLLTPLLQRTPAAQVQCHSTIVLLRLQLWSRRPSLDAGRWV